MSCCHGPIRGICPQQVQVCEGDTEGVGQHNLPDPASVGCKSINEPNKQKMFHFTFLHKSPDLEQSRAYWPAGKHQVLAKGYFCPALPSLPCLLNSLPLVQVGGEGAGGREEMGGETQFQFLVQKCGSQFTPSTLDQNSFVFFL